MSYKCIMALESKLDRIVEAVIEEGAAETEDGNWRLPLNDLAKRYGADEDCRPALLSAMLLEREEITGVKEADGVFQITFDKEYCAYYQKRLFDPERMQTTAVYTLNGPDGPHHFHTEQAGGYSLAYEVARQLANIGSRRMPDGVSSAELMPLLVSDYHFLKEWVRLFRPIPEEEAQRLLSAGDGRTAFHITLHPEKGAVHIQSLPDAAECSLPELTLRINGRGFTCEKLYEIASGPEACFASEENVELDIARLHEKVFRQTISHNLQTFETRSAELDEALPESRPEPAQSGMTFV